MLAGFNFFLWTFPSVDRGEREEAAVGNQRGHSPGLPFFRRCVVLLRVSGRSELSDTQPKS